MVPVNLGRRRVPVNRNVCYESTYLLQDHPYQTLSYIIPRKSEKSTESRKGVAVVFPFLVLLLGPWGQPKGVAPLPFRQVQALELVGSPGASPQRTRSRERWPQRPELPRPHGPPGHPKGRGIDKLSIPWEPQAPWHPPNLI